MKKPAVNPAGFCFKEDWRAALNSEQVSSYDVQSAAN